ncbi:MAG: hypothetical protein JNL58_16500 [Planctomyces sp.]|nr:hypothetical protein [Planctomyces sp.]
MTREPTKKRVLTLLCLLATTIVTGCAYDSLFSSLTPTGLPSMSEPDPDSAADED